MIIYITPFGVIILACLCIYNNSCSTSSINIYYEYIQTHLGFLPNLIANVHFAAEDAYQPLYACQSKDSTSFHLVNGEDFYLCSLGIWGLGL